MRAAETVAAMRAAAMDEDVHAVVVLLVVTLVVWWRDACAMWIGSMDWMCDAHVHVVFMMWLCDVTRIRIADSHI